jgi:hypothetical protein
MQEESAIRSALKVYLSSSAVPNTLIVDELAVCERAARVDIAVINGHLHAYEIKSAKDNLKRLAKQIREYSRIFDHVTVVTTKDHLEGVISIVPAWCGIMVIEPNPPSAFTVHRVDGINPEVDCHSLAMLLWKDELHALTSGIEMRTGLKNKSRAHLAECFSSMLPTRAVARAVRETLKQRNTWRAGRTLELCDD